MNNKRLVRGVGINDADYKVYEIVNGKVSVCPFYRRWANMLERCYSEKYHNKFHTYKGCYVCDQWLIFSNFKSWMEQQDWEGKQLDKDLLFYQNKVYSPETCVFINNHINSFLTCSIRKDGDCPLGVGLTKNGRYRARIKAHDSNSNLDLGTYDDPMVAHRVWQTAKIKEATQLQLEQTKQLQSTQVNNRVIQGLQRVIDKIQYEYDNGFETKDF